MCRRLVVAVIVMVAVDVGGGTKARPGFSWCTKKDLDNLRVTNAKYPDMNLIPVEVKSTIVTDVVKEMFLRQQTPCEDIAQHEEVTLDWYQAKLVMEDDEIVLFWRSPYTLPIFQEVEDFCITKGDNTTNYLAKFCFPIPYNKLKRELETCSEIPCVRKCCSAGRSLNRDSMCTPVEPELEWQPSLNNSDSYKKPVEITTVYGPPLCEQALAYYDFTILPSGTIDLGGIKTDIDGYCIDSVGDPTKPIALACDYVAVSETCRLKEAVMKPVLLGFSAVCLLVVWVVYLSVPKLRSLNEGRCLLSLVSAFIVSHVTLVILFTIDSEAKECRIIGRVCHFAVLASYFWMNVVSFHTFVQLRSHMDSKWESPKVFALYSIYAWGVPLLVVGVGAGLDVFQANAWRPHMDLACWFQEPIVYWIYLYGPMLVVLLINSVLFVGCVVLMAAQRRRTFTPSPNQAHTYSAWVYVKLFIIMGILWITEVVAWYFFPYCSTLSWVFDAINSLQGTFVFLVTICFRRDLKVFHCGRPKLIQKGKHSEVTGTTDESEMTNNPLVS